MTKIKTVFLDMDGVITDFVGGVCTVFDKPNPYPKETRDYTFWNAWPEISTKIVDIKCTTDFWANLNWGYDGYGILRAVLNKFHADQIYLLTAPMSNLESASGKMIWVDKNLPVYLKRTIITQVPKSLLAMPNTLLIDDKNENIDEFCKAGGQGILVPRPWNRLHAVPNTVLFVEKCLEGLL